VKLLAIALFTAGATAATSLVGRRADTVHVADTVQVHEWPVPWERSRPRDPDVAPDGTVWFVGQVGDYVASLVPATGAFHRYPPAPGTGPHNQIVDARGAVWYAGNRVGHIGRLDPATGAITTYPMPDPAARDPHTLAFDSRGDIWFTVQGGNFVGRLDVTSGEVRLWPVATPNARPYGIAVDQQDRPWIALFGTNTLATVRDGALVTHALPRANARPRRLALTSDGGVWYVDYAGGFLGRFDPETGNVQEWPAPAAARSRPYAMAADDRDRLWLVETGPQPNRLVAFDPATQQFRPPVPIPSGGGTVRHMVFHRPTRTLWFGTDANTIGRARVP
jgi:virginiamycin B lyase